RDRRPLDLGGVQPVRISDPGQRRGETLPQPRHRAYQLLLQLVRLQRGQVGVTPGVSGEGEAWHAGNAHQLGLLGASLVLGESIALDPGACSPRLYRGRAALELPVAV